jgi:uncharacterized protein (TIGR04255 family)
MSEKLPTFRKPPVVETVLGVQYDPIPGLSNAHLGAFWKWLLAHPKSAPGTGWTKVSDAPPIEPSFEQFSEGQGWSPDKLNLRIGLFSSSRLQIRNDANDAMIQVQNGRLHYNWIGRRGRDYERYTNVRPEFDRLYECFQDFLRQEQLGTPKENQWEVTYVNHIPRGTVWQTPEDWPKLFVGLPGTRTAPSEVRLESIGGTWHYEIPPRRGRLHVELKGATRLGPEPNELLHLMLTARGPVGDPAVGDSSLSDGLDLGRRVIVLTFKEITSKDAHKVWELET